MDSLLRLPNEIILDIAEYFDVEEINALTQTCYRLHELLNPLLYRRGLEIDYPALEWAAAEGNLDTTRHVLHYTTPPPNMLSYALGVACGKGCIEMARLLLQHGARTDDGQDPLFKAATGRHFELVRLLIEYGAAPARWTDADQKGRLVAGCTTLKGTTEYDLEILDFLIQQGMDVIQDDNIAWSALRYGCKLPVITHLVGLGLNPNARVTWWSFDLLHSVIRDTKPDNDAVCAGFVQRSIEMGADINVVDCWGVGLLHLAASGGLVETMRVLIAAGIDVDKREMPLVWAFRACHAEAIEELLAAGADIAATYNHVDGYSLDSAIRHGDHKCVRLVLTAGLKQISRMRASDLLLAAAMLGDDAAARRVVNECEGLDLDLVELEDWNQTTTLKLAARFSRHDDLRDFMSTVDPRESWRGVDGNSALHLAVYSGCDLAVRLLLQQWQDLNVRNNYYSTPLALAVKYGSAAVVEDLLDSGSDLTVVDYCRESLLHIAVWRGGDDLAVIRLLLNRNVPMNLKNNRGQTPLSLAIWNDQEDLVKILLDFDVSIEDRDGSGCTPLMVAALTHSRRIVEILTEEGAQLDATCDRGLRAGTTAFRMALEGVDGYVADHLLDAGANPIGRTRQGRTLLMRAIQRKWRWGACRMLQAHGKNLDLDVAAEDDRAQTALTWASQSGSPDVVRELLRHGANVNHCDADGGTLLTWAAYGGNIDVLHAVVDSLGIDPLLEVEDKYGNTPLFIAASRGHMGAVEWLVAHGANLDHRNGSGQTAASLAAQKDHLELLLWLVRRGVGITDAEWRTCMYVNSYDLCGRVIYPPQCIRNTDSAWG